MIVVLVRIVILSEAKGLLFAGNSRAPGSLPLRAHRETETLPAIGQNG
jgi:hypothetical protein